MCHGVSWIWNSVDGKSGVGAFVKEVFQGRKIVVVGDVCVEGSDINKCHDGVKRKRYGERSFGLKQVLGTFNI